MAVYYGVVRGNRIELEDEAYLAEGTRVEVHAPPTFSGDRGAAEDQAKAHLRAAGLLAPATAEANTTEEEDDFEPVTAQGEWLSKQIIRERR